VVTSAGPALQSRKTSTEFNVMAGETIVLSGLLQRESSGSVDKVPGLGDMPVIGALFRSRRFQNKETELVVFVTPTVIEANDPAQQARLGHVQQRLQSGLQEPAGKTGP
jgi:pilus assembly protein CpaC